MSCNYGHTTCCEHIPHYCEKNCVLDTLKLINRLQQQCPDNEKSCLRCDKPFLGHHCTANTRPIILYTESGCPFEISLCDEPLLNGPMVFRVEDVRGNCVTLRLLLPTPSCFPNEAINCSSPKWVLSQSCVTIDANVFSGIQCLSDTWVKLHYC